MKWEITEQAIGRYATREEAIAAPVADLDPDDEVTVHQAICQGGEKTCTCAPDVYVIPKPARA